MMKRFSIAFLVFLPLSVLAQNVQYEDIQPNAWFFNEVASFLEQDYLDDSQEVFRPADFASRAEFLKLITELNGGILDELPDVPSFADVATDDWFFPYIEESAREGWVRGDGDCYQVSSLAEPRDVPCFVRPHDPISRAEAAVLMQRAFGKTSLGRAPAFADNPSGSWFAEAIHIAADHCILRGDDNTRNVRPGSSLNRAEMVVMLWRVDNGGKYPDC